MARTVDVNELKGRLIPLIEKLDLELAELSAPIAGGRLILRFSIHSSKGVTLDDCAKVSRCVSEYLDTEDLIAGKYMLEVSSLGLDKPLKELIDFKRRIGEKVEISFNGETGKRKQIVGILKNTDDVSISVDTKKEMVVIPVDTNPIGKILV